MTDGRDPQTLLDVLARFPGSGNRIRDLFKKNEQFREMCADYTDCLSAFRRLREQGAARDERIEEYGEMRAYLERELLVQISGAAGERSGA
ncbi:MAG: hypothetical protein ACF8R7_13135 [Phycisphaerales bacterium JB039]